MNRREVLGFPEQLKEAGRLAARHTHLTQLVEDDAPTEDGEQNEQVQHQLDHQSGTGDHADQAFLLHHALRLGIRS
ncbi:MAG: hypothetical protein ACHQM4_11315, partial [Thermoanaerobaculia bacterium]